MSQFFPSATTRRNALIQGGAGFGALALAGMLGRDSLLASDASESPFAARHDGLTTVYTKVADVPGTSTTITGLTSGFSYQYAVSAYNASGNESGRHGNATA